MSQKGCSTPCPGLGPCINDQCKCPDSFGGDSCVWRQCKEASLTNFKTCECSNGFTGRLCNICKTDDDCKNFNGADFLDNKASDDDPLICNPTSYVGKRHHGSCRLHSPQMESVYKKGKKYIAFNRIRGPDSIVASLWIDENEQFECFATQCSNEVSNTQDKWQCKEIKCQCIPGAIMCRDDDSPVNVGHIINAIKGPFTMSCPFLSTYPIYQDVKFLKDRATLLNDTSNRKCKFGLKSLAELLSTNIDGLELHDCEFGECARLSTFDTPPNFTYLKWTTMDILLTTFCAGLLFAFWLLLVLGLRQRRAFRRRSVPPPSYPKEYSFSQVSYTLDKKPILTNLQGSFTPSTLTAIMGPSGAGKSSLLDILAHKPKKGLVTAQFQLDHLPLPLKDKRFRHMIGFVDQEDVLLPWLTVEESLWFVAHTRLPESMSKEEKEKIIDNALRILNISHLRQSKIGGLGAFRGISGGERRRLSVAMELITSPSILFLDEPTTGLDSHNAYKLMKCLADLAHFENKTIICTIHQPRHDVYTLFDQVFLMSQGLILYQGPSAEAKSFFNSLGFACPENRQICDYLIDLAMNPNILASMSLSAPTTDSFVKTNQLDSFFKFIKYLVWDLPLSLFFRLCSWFTHLNLKSKDLDDSPMYCVSYLTQFKYLLERSIKCSLRNKQLFIGHNVFAVFLGGILGGLYSSSSSNLSGYINLIGLIIFLHLMISFSSLSTLSHMSSDRLLFIRERGNAYYRPSIYFLTKLLTDLFPLRILPVIFLGTFVFLLGGFDISAIFYFKFMLVLLLFTTSISLVSMLISVMCSDYAVANFVISVTMLLFMLFSGIWVNLKGLTPLLSWLQYFSPSRWSSEALATSQLEFKLFTTEVDGMEIPLTGIFFLSFAFGFERDQFYRNLYALGGLNLVLLIVLGLFIVHRLKEIR